MNTQQLQHELGFFQPYQSLTEQSTPFGQLFNCTIDTNNPAYIEFVDDLFWSDEQAFFHAYHGYDPDVSDVVDTDVCTYRVCQQEDLDIRTFVQNGFRFIQVRLHGVSMDFETYKVTRIQ